MPWFNKRKEHEIIKERFLLKDVLGTGAFSKVFLAVPKDGDEAIAIKCIDRKLLKGFEGALENEIKVHKLLRHPKIVQLLETAEDKRHVYLMMELLTGGELFDRVVAMESFRYTERTASALLKQILEAVDFMHKNGVIHRDLKPENVLFEYPDDDIKIKVIDFGMTKRERDPETISSACGTPGYVAPEILAQREYGSKVDVWSIGVIAYILLCGYPPFYHEDDVQLYVQILRGEFEFDSPYWDEISDSAKDFITHIMRLDEAKRYSCTEALQHPWISGNTALDKDISEGVKDNLKERLLKDSQGYGHGGPMIG